MKDPTLPGLDPESDNAFLDALGTINAEKGRAKPRVETPGIYPKLKDVKPSDYTQISDEEMEREQRRKHGFNLFKTDVKFDVHFGRFNISDPEQLETLEKIETEALRGRVWLVQERWIETKDGNVFVAVKWFTPERTK